MYTFFAGSADGNGFLTGYQTGTFGKAVLQVFFTPGDRSQVEAHLFYALGIFKEPFTFAEFSQVPVARRSDYTKAVEELNLDFLFACKDAVQPSFVFRFVAVAVFLTKFAVVRVEVFVMISGRGQPGEMVDRYGIYLNLLTGNLFYLRSHVHPRVQCSGQG